MTFAEHSMREFLEAVAAKQPTPGGGAVASVVAALASALGRMVVNYSIAKKSLASHHALHAEAIIALQEIGERAIKLAQADAEAYGHLNSLWKLDADDPVRIAEFPDAVDKAIAAPHAILHACMETLRLLIRLCGTTNAMLSSDLAIAAVLAEAGARSAAWNVRINLPLLEDEAVRSALEKTIGRSLADAQQLTRDIESACSM